jgi:DNA-binding response OmpR family regulator
VASNLVGPDSIYISTRLFRGVHNLKILIAEDEPELLRFYKIFLEDLGYDVITARDGQECLDAYHRGLNTNKRFDLVILDHRMPKKDGMQVAKEIAAMAPFQKFLMVTAYADVIDSSQKPENMKIMIKPFDEDELVSTIKELTR